MRMHAPTQVSGDFLEVRSSTGWVPLSFIERPEAIYLLATGNDARWCTFILRKGVAEIRKGDAHGLFRAVLETDMVSREAAIEGFRTKYGKTNFERWFPAPGRLIRVNSRQESPASTGDNYYNWLESEFDSVSCDYDRHITGNSINMLLRERSLWLMRQTFRKKSRLLEIGCGSGMETIPMLRDGHEITAVDISSSMLEIVKQKAKSEGLGEKLSTVKLRASELRSLSGGNCTGLFDGCYSTYGALNCEQSLDGIPEAIHSLLNDEGMLVAGVFNKYCMSEGLAYSLSFRPVRALRRLRNPIMEGNSRFCVDVFSYSVPGFSRIFSPYFRTERVIGVPVILPPSDMDGYMTRLSRRFDLLKMVDFKFSTRWPFHSLGDHFLLSMRRESVPPGMQ